MREHTKISTQTRERVKGRDGGACVVCRRKGVPLECAHYIPRSQGGMGIPQNLVMLCHTCHTGYDNGGYREAIGEILRDYLKGWYPDWDGKELVYDKWKWTKDYAQSEDKTGSGSEV